MHSHRFAPALITIAVASMTTLSRPALAECTQTSQIEEIAEIAEIAAAVDDAVSTIEEPRLRYSHCEPISFVTDADLRSHDIQLAVPLCELSTAPMSASEFAASIDTISLLPPWSLSHDPDGAQVEYEIQDADAVCPTLAIRVSGIRNGAASAWRKVPAPFSIMTTSRQHVVLEVATPQIANDVTAHTRAMIENNIAVAQGSIELDLERIANLEARIADPSLIKTSLTDDIAELEAEIAQLGNQAGWRVALLESLMESDARQRAQSLKRSQDWLTQMRESLERDEAKRARYQAQLENLQPVIRQLPTEHTTTCDALTAAD